MGADQIHHLMMTPFENSKDKFMRYNQKDHSE